MDDMKFASYAIGFAMVCMGIFLLVIAILMIRDISTDTDIKQNNNANQTQLIRIKQE